MEIKIGGVYRTRSGRKAIVEQLEGMFFYGRIYWGDDSRRYIWHRSGVIEEFRPLPEDIVSDWEEPALTREKLEDFTPSKKAKAIQADRDQVYGDARYSFARIAKVWSGILHHDVTPTQVARCMAGLKLVRDDLNPEHKDSLIDLINYADLTEYLKQFETNDSST